MKTTFNRLACELKNYFAPPPKDALDDAREKARFSDVQRHLRIYLRALWNCEFVIKQGAIDAVGDEINRPFIEYNVVNLPHVFYDSTQEENRRVTGTEIYRAAATHAAAHIIYTKQHFSARSLDKWQIAMISVIEDARVETLAIREFPGLKHLWAKLHTATPQDNQTAGNYLDRLARALLDDSYQDEDSWIKQGRALFGSADNLDDDQIFRAIGIKLADSFRAKKIKFNIHSDTLSAPYRDDNRFLWRRQSVPLELFSPFFRHKAIVGVEEGDKVLKNHLVPKPDESANGKQVVATYFYPEWNYRSRVEDQAWVTLRESDPETGDIKIIDNIIAENQHLISRMKAILRAIRDGHPTAPENSKRVTK